MKLTENIKKTVLVSCLTFITPVIPAATGITDYDYVASTLFWHELYTYGGWTLYCGYRFETDKRTQDGRFIGIEHIYPTSLMFKQAGCDSRMQCRESNNKKFARMESDMHNMYPVWQNMVTYRYNRSYGVIPGEEWRFDDCDFEWKSGVVEPRPLARGNIARAIFYMHTKYGVVINPGMIKLLKVWNREDPPSDQEIARNDKIEKLQGQRNPYIDKPSLADKISIRAER
ncbi:MAG: endonuclease [Gammaproteobacteria bacterium]